MSTNDIIVTRAGHVVTVELNRPPANHFDAELLRDLADHLQELDDDPHCRAVLLCSAGRHFCAGADFSHQSATGFYALASAVYEQGLRLFQTRTPIVAAVQGTAVGGGLGLACVADLRVASPETRFVANFARLGLHHGFGLTVTLPEIVGRQRATDMLYTSTRVDGESAYRIGLADRLVPAAQLRSAAHRLAEEIAAAAPLAVAAIRATMRSNLVERIRSAIDHELTEQDRLSHTADSAEGIQASLHRRPAQFHGR